MPKCVCVLSIPRAIAEEYRRTYGDWPFDEYALHNELSFVGEPVEGRSLDLTDLVYSEQIVIREVRYNGNHTCINTVVEFALADETADPVGVVQFIQELKGHGWD